MSSHLTADRLLCAWEATLDEPELGRGAVLLAACRDIDTGEVADWSVRARDLALFDLRIELFGAQARAVIDCPHCPERLDVELDLRVLRPVAGNPADEDELLGTVDGHDVIARRPTTADLAAACATASLDDAPVALLRRCLTSVNAPNRGVLDSDDLDAELERALRAWMSEQLDVDAPSLAMTCTACAQLVEAPFDIAAFVVADVDAWAEQTTYEVHALASAYGWTETEALALSARRRARYLDLVAEAPEPWPTR